jgi:hypothetical protein
MKYTRFIWATATTVLSTTFTPRSGSASQSNALCYKGSQTTEHLLQVCPLHEALRHASTASEVLKSGVTKHLSDQQEVE